VSAIHLRHLNPFPPNLGEVLGAFEQVLVAELNAGQLAMLLRARFLVPAHFALEDPGTAVQGAGDPRPHRRAPARTRG
jgi:2-oxoglutarate ferredoxin oxidoreductase subunit alpha